MASGLKAGYVVLVSYGLVRCVSLSLHSGSLYLMVEAGTARCGAGHMLMLGGVTGHGTRFEGGL